MSARIAGSMLWLLAMLAASAQAQTVEYLHTDALGSVVAVTNASRTVLERREYEPYGSQLTPAVTNGPGYTGHVQDAATGLVYMQQRYYDAQIGRFLSADPVAATIDDFNRYAYVRNNPLNGPTPPVKLCGSLCRGSELRSRRPSSSQVPSWRGSAWQQSSTKRRMATAALRMTMVILSRL